MHPSFDTTDRGPNAYGVPDTVHQLLSGDIVTRGKIARAPYSQ